MSETKHPWCSDVSRDEAIRAAEDAAAAERTPPPDHRDLPSAVNELREKVAKIEEAMVSGSTWFPKSDKPAPTPPSAPPQITEGDTLATVRDGGGRPMPKGPPPGLRAENREAAPVSRKGVSADGLRTERVTLEITHGNNFPPAEWVWVNIMPLSPGESVRVVWGGDEERPNDLGMLCTASELADRCTELARRLVCQGDEMDRLTAERDAAKEECGRLRHLLKTKESECETHHPWVHPSSAPAANAGGEARQEPVAWVATKPGDDGGYQRCLGWDRHKVIHGIDLDASSQQVSVSPLFSAPQPPRGWLTEDDCAALYLACAVLDGVFVGSWQEKHDAARRLVSIRERARREAGGEVQDG